MKLDARPLIGFLTASGLAVFMHVGSVHAGAFAVREQSAYGQGVAFAGMAAGGSLSSIYWNPATLSQVMGLEVEGIASFIVPRTDVTITSPTGPGPFDFTGGQGDVGLDALVPATYVGYRINDNIILGVGVNAPFGSSTVYPQSSPLRQFGITGRSEIKSINVNPMIAYQVNDYISFGVGAQIQYFDAKLTDLGASFGPTLPPIPGLPAYRPGIGTFDANDIAFGFTAGIQIMPFDGTEIGLGFRSSIDHELSGSLNGSLARIGPIPAAGFSADVNADLQTPETVTFGIRQRVNNTLTLMGGIEWTNWSRFDEVPLSGLANPDFVLPFDYQDGWFFSGGAEVAINDQFAVRGGVGYEVSPISDDARTYRLPDDDRLWLSAGASYRASNRFSFDLGYSFITTFDIKIDNDNPQNGGLLPLATLGLITETAANVDAHVHVLALGVTFKLGHTNAPMIGDPVYTN